MSVPNKSLDKSKRYAGVKANDFVNKTRTADVNRSIIRPQGWANLGKINSRRIPPPANLPSLKSETGVQVATFDPTGPVNHGWNSTENPSLNNSQTNATQQQIDSLSVHSSTAAPMSADIDKSRMVPTWSNITAGTTITQPIPNLLALNDFPCLANSQDRKSSSIDSTSQQSNLSFRPANLSTSKEGRSRIQPLMNDVPPMSISTNNSPLMQPGNSRMYSSSPMWAYPVVPPGPVSYHAQQRQNAMNDYKTPTILRHKDIDNLSKLTDNTWANASQEINYEEKIRFSDDEDDLQSKAVHDSTSKPRRNQAHFSSHTRLIEDDEHLKQLQDNKNSELINALTVAKQRRAEQERHLKNKSTDDHSISTVEENQSMSGHQMRPLLTVHEQENFNDSSWHSNRDGIGSSRTRHDTANSQTFSMKSWSDQMDSFNYASVHEKSSGHLENDPLSTTNENNPTKSESSSPSPIDTDRKMFKLKKGPQPLMQSKISSKQYQQSNSSDYQENFSSHNTNGQWKNRHEFKDNQYSTHGNDHQNHRTSNYVDQSIPKRLNGSNKQAVNQKRNSERSQNNPCSKVSSSSSQLRVDSSNDLKSTAATNRNQQTRRATSPTRVVDQIQESTNYKSQQRTNTNDSKQRYSMSNTTHLDTSSIPPLMSVRSDVTGSTHYSQHHEFYNENNADKTTYYHQSTNSRYPNTNRGYTTLGRYRRASGYRQQVTSQPYSTYPLSSPSTNNVSRQKKNSSSNQKKSNQMKTSNNDEIIVPLMSQQTIFEPVINSSSILETPTSNESKPNDDDDEKGSITKVDHHQSTKSNGILAEKLEKESTMKTNSKRRNHQDQQNFYQNQRVRMNYTRTNPNYESMQMTPTQHYYNNSRRSNHPSQNCHVHDGTSGYYYESAQSQYNQQYVYSNSNYSTSQSMHSNGKKVGKRGQSSAIIYRQGKTRMNNENDRHHSTSDNDQKEGEEWETASESSTNMRNGHHDNSSSIPTRTPPKKSFTHQRPHARHIFKYTNA